MQSLALKVTPILVHTLARGPSPPLVKKADDQCLQSPRQITSDTKISLRDLLFLFIAI